MELYAGGIAQGQWVGPRDCDAAAFGDVWPQGRLIIREAVAIAAEAKV
jgi:hypothetical protein